MSTWTGGSTFVPSRHGAIASPSKARLRGGALSLSEGYLAFSIRGDGQDGLRRVSFAPLSRHPLLSDVGSSSPGQHANHELSPRALLRFRNTGPSIRGPNKGSVCSTAQRYLRCWLSAPIPGMEQPLRPRHWAGGPCHSIRGGGYGQPKLRLDELPTDGGEKFRFPIWWSRGVAVTITRFADCPVWHVSPFY